MSKPARLSYYIASPVGPRQVTGYGFGGDWGSHYCRSDRCWSLDHLPTGRRAAGFKNKADAIDALRVAAPLAAPGGDAVGVAAALPSDFSDWLLACSRVAALVRPVPCLPPQEMT